MGDNAKVIIKRDPIWIDSIFTSPFEVFINGKKWGFIQIDETIEIEIEPNEIEIYLNHPWFWFGKSNEYIFKAYPRQNIFFKCIHFEWVKTT